MEDEEDDEEGDESGDEGEDRGSTGTDRLLEEFTKEFGWIHSAVKVRETTGYDMDRVFDMNIVEFLNYLVYIKSWANIQNAINKEEAKKLRR